MAMFGFGGVMVFSCMNSSNKKYFKKRNSYLRESQDRPGDAIFSNIKVGLNTSNMYKDFFGNYGYYRLKYDNTHNFNNKIGAEEIEKNKQHDKNIRLEYSEELSKHAKEMRENFNQLSAKRGQNSQCKSMFNSYLKKCSKIYDDFLDFYENGEEPALMRSVLYSLNRALFDLKAFAYGINSQAAISCVNSIEQTVITSLNDCIHNVVIEGYAISSKHYKKGGLEKSFKLW